MAARQKITACLSLALVAGCGSGLPASTTLSSADRSASGMASDAASTASLLYVSDAGTFDVYVYTFPELKPAGKLTGFDEPQGECSDKSGNVWITNTVSQQVLEFAHGGKHAIRTLTDPSGYPGGCAVDASSGDLAVTNVFNNSGAGEVLIYHGGRGTPTPYSNPAVTFYYFDGYDAAGNLYVSGSTAGRAYVLSRLARGRHKLESLSVRGGTVHFPGSVQWIGTGLVLGDQECDGKKSACFYEATVRGSLVKIARKTALTGSCDVAEAWIQHGLIAAADYDDCRRSRSGAYLWKYPGGGTAIRGVSGLMRPIGATISNR